MNKLRRILCWFGFHRTSSNEWGCDLQRGVVEYFCTVCGVIAKTVSLDDSAKAGEVIDILNKAKRDSGGEVTK